MKNKLLRLLPLVGLAVMLVLSPLSSTALGSEPQGTEFAPGRILVKFKLQAGPADRAALHRAQRGHLIQKIPGIKVEVVSVPPGAERARAAAYARSPLVAYAEPDYIAYAMGDPSDEHFAEQWGLNNTGQPYKDSLTGTPDADIDAPEAWDILLGSADVWIAILDTGIDQDHPDLDDKLVGSIDFTGSGGVDDLYGHGTHVAGIAAAETNNSLGVAGVGYNSSMLNVKVLNDQGSGYYAWIANGIIWATYNGADVINMSLGGTRKSRTLEKAVNYAWSNGVVLVAAAGNSGNPSPTYPAKYENCIAVAATDSSDQKAPFSEYGDWVDVAAPGVDIFSTFPNHPYVIGKSLNYDYGSGTSMSTPFVSGLAALVWATGYTSNSAVRDQIETTADPIPGTGQYWIHGRINACNAVGGNCPYEGAEPTPTPIATATATPTPAPGSKMHVASINMALKTAGINTSALATVTVVDADNNPVEGATVYGQWSNATSDTDSGVTDGNGEVTLQSDNIKRAPAGKTFTFTVDNVALSGWTYDSSANIKTTDSISVP